jgi:type IV secretion system protein VirD4
VEDFIEHPTGVYIVLPEEDTTKYFIVSLVIQQINAELTAMADRLGGSLPKKVLCFYDELGTIPKIEGLDAIFTASRSRNMSIVGILQGTSQLKERYGEETAETMFNSCHDTIAGAFGPLSQDAEFISKQLGSRTAQTGSVTTDGKTGEQSSTQQMMEVPLMAPNELREMPKGEFVLLKTFCRSTKTHMPLFTEWGITLEEKYSMPERAIREIKYMDVPELMKKLNRKVPSQGNEAKKEDETSGNTALWVQAQQKKE